jgi:quinol monooxygenase YgiN
MTSVLVRARVETEQRRELMQMCKSWVSEALPPACSERRVYEDALSPTDLLLVENWVSKSAMNSCISSEKFRALIGAVKVLGTLVDVCISETTVVEAG